ncbi:MAG: SMI1/KNR4 family protein [bacterium]|nr:SMI1/KNR4 family protein [bacterium]
MTENIDVINGLIFKSDGDFIDIGTENKQRFILKKKYTPDEIEVFESKNKIILPNEYKYFLIHVGACELYSEENSNHFIEFHLLEDLFENYKDSFENPEEWLFKKFLPVGVDNGLQEHFGYSFFFKKPTTFFVLFHEYYLDEIEEEDDPNFPAHICTFSEYIAEIIANKGDLEPH